MGSHCAANVNKFKLGTVLIQVFSNFGSNPLSSVNGLLGLMITERLIQEVLTLPVTKASNIERLNIGKGCAQGFRPFSREHFEIWVIRPDALGVLYF